MRLVLQLAYSGLGFRGWQRLPGERTVQGELEARLSELGLETRVQGASRTDAGVHARAQVAQFKTSGEALAPFQGETRLLEKALAKRLPRDLYLHALRLAPPHFHAAFSSRGKVYSYLVALPHDLKAAADDPFLTTRCWCLPDPRSFEAPPPKGQLDLDAMRAGLKLLIGRRDFSALATRGHPRGKVRTQRRLGFGSLLARPYNGRAGGSLVALTVTGDAFLRHQVRNLTGLLLQLGYGQLRPSQILELMEERRSHWGPRAPGRGLTLQQVRYPLALNPFKEALRAPPIRV